jgi:hypothetical protein
MLRVERAALMLAGLALFGCGAASDHQITGPPSLQQRGGQQSATGHAHLFVQDCDEHYSFSAIRHPDGSVTGEWQVHDICTLPEGTIIAHTHGTVTCLTILPDGKTARIGGVVTGSNYPTVEPPQEAGWTVRDNGEGAKDPPDAVSGLYFGLVPGTAEFFCDVGAPLEMFANERGNIQVRP